MKKMKVVVVDGDARVCDMAKRGLESGGNGSVGTANMSRVSWVVWEKQRSGCVLTELIASNGRIYANWQNQ